MKSTVAACIVWILTVILSGTAGAVPKTEDFSRLKASRVKIMEDIESLKEKMGINQREQDNLRLLKVSKELIDQKYESLKKEYYALQKKFDAEQKKSNKDEELIVKLNDDKNSIQQDLDVNKKLLDQFSSLPKEMEALKKDLKKQELELIHCENQIQLALESDEYAQLFKIWVSGFFAAMVMALIIGFYWKVGSTVFSGQTGIQFVTLFSLIIAIILFGITGILADKELSALLGGLSGYILGKYNGKGDGGDTNNANNGSPVPPAGGGSATGR